MEKKDHNRQSSRNFRMTTEAELTGKTVEILDDLTVVHDTLVDNDLSGNNMISQFKDNEQLFTRKTSHCKQLPSQQVSEPSQNTRRVHPNNMMMTELQSALKRKTDGVDVKYNFLDMCTEESPGKLLQKMSFDIPLKGLYEILDTCSTNELNLHCPVVVAVNDQHLQQLYGGAYLIQVWNNSKQKIFERVSDAEPNCWNIIGDSFVFQLNLEKFDIENRINRGYQILNFQGDQLASIFAVKIKNDTKEPALTENMVAVWGGYLIIANETEIRFLNISKLKSTSVSKNDKEKQKSNHTQIVNYSDFQIVTINSIRKQKIKAIQDGEENSCMFICEDIDTGKLAFYKLISIDLNSICKFQRLAPEPIEQEQNQASPILKLYSVMIYLPDIKQLKQIGIVLHENLNIDFYYDYQCVEKLVSTDELIFFDVSVSFRQLHFKAFDLSTPGKEKLKTFSTATIWKQKIGMTSDPSERSKLITDLLDDNQPGILNELNSLFVKNDDSQWTKSIRKRLQKCRAGVNNLVELAQQQQNFGFLSICSSYVQLYTSFLNTGRKVLVSHGRFVSTYSMKNLLGKWSRNHHDLKDKVRTMFILEKNEERDCDNIIALVGYHQFRFFKIQDLSDIVLTQFEINTKTPIVQFLQENSEVFYMVCRQTNQDSIKYNQIIDQKTTIHMPFIDNPTDEFSILALFNNELTTLKDPFLQRFQNDAKFKICLQKGNHQNQILIVDSYPEDAHHQVRLELQIVHADLFTHNKIQITSAKEFEIDYSEKKAAHKTGRIIGQLVSKNKIIQVAKNHVLVLEEAKGLLKVVEVFEDRNIDSFLFLDDKWLYTLSSSFISFDNELKKPYGPLRDKGLYAYDVQQLVDQSQIQAFFLDDALARVNDLIEYDINSQQMAFMKNYNVLKIIPLPHRSNIQLFGMGIKEDYLLCHFYKGTFTAVDKKSKMTMWSTATGKLLYLKQKKFFQDVTSHTSQQSLKVKANSAPKEETDLNQSGINQLRNYDVYRANSEDVSWMNDLIHGEDLSRSLIVSGSSIEHYKLKEAYKSAQANQPPKHLAGKQTLFSVIEEYHQNVEMEFFNFKLLEMWQQDIDDEQTQDDGTWIKIKFEDMEKPSTKKIVWKEKMTFDLKLPVDKEKRPFIYFSQDLKKMMISPPGDPHPVIYECIKSDLDSKVNWKLIKRITRFPIQLKGSCSSNCLFSPNFEFFIDFDFSENQFVIKETMKEEIIKLIPSGMINLTVSGKDKSPMQIPFVGSRIMFQSKDEIRIQGSDSLDVIVKLDYSDKSETGINISSFVAVDNYDPDSFVDRHVFVEKAEISINDTFKRLIRKSQEFKQLRVHSEIQIREQEQKETKVVDEHKIKELLRQIAYKEIFSVNYLEKKYFSVDLSFTILDWLIIKQVLEDKNFNFKQIAPKQLIQMCFNIFPKLQSVLHLLANNFKSAKKQLKYVNRIFKGARSGYYSDGISLTLPITQDEDLMTPLDICLQENNLNINMVDIILEEIKDYPLLHSSHLLQSVVCKSIKYNVPCIGEYLDARIIPSLRLESSESMSSGAIKEELLNEVCGQKLGWGEFSIWESKSSLRKNMFDDEAGFQTHLDLAYFDIPSINDLSVKSNEFFEVLSDTENIGLFKHRSVNIIVEKAWAEHRTFFICFFTIPYIILVAAYFFWSNFTSVPFEKSGFATEEAQIMAGLACHVLILVFASFFLIQEMYQLQADPKDYFSSMWNFLDIATMVLAVIPPSNEIRNQFHCIHQHQGLDECIDGVPKWQSIHTTKFIFYTNASASLALWMKLTYYVRMYKPTSYLIRAAIKVISGMKTFMFVYLIACFAFSDAFYTASEYHKKFFYDEEGSYYGSWKEAFISTYYFMMAGTGELNNTQTPLAFFLFFFASIVIYLCMLNLLIASVGSIFQDVQQTQDQYAMQERAQLISDVRSFPITQYFVTQREPETFLFIASFKNWRAKSDEKNKEKTQ